MQSPGEYSLVISIGGLSLDNNIAGFSSRGMTKMELNNGIGRVKPDIVTYSEKLLVSDSNNCVIKSGTSMSSAIMSGIVALMLSTKNLSNNNYNNGIVKQLLYQSTSLLQYSNMYEQGSGKINTTLLFDNIINHFHKTITLMPSKFNMSDNYYYPYTLQSLFYSCSPVLLNITIVNSYTNFYSLIHNVILVNESIPGCIDVKLLSGREYDNYEGTLAISITVRKYCKKINDIYTGTIKFQFQSSADKLIYSVSFMLELKIIPPPPKSQRILWDQYHNIYYPPEYVLADHIYYSVNILFIIII